MRFHNKIPTHNGICRKLKKKRLRLGEHTVILFLSVATTDTGPSEKIPSSRPFFAFNFFGHYKLYALLNVFKSILKI